MQDVIPLKNPPKKTILIFGISSLVGSNLAEFLKKDYRVVGTYYNNPIKIPGVLTVRCNVLTKEEVQLVVYAFKPDVTIYAVGLSSLQECSEREGLAEALNTSGLFNVSEYCQRYKSQVCYLSSSFVFSGENKKYMEMDIPDASCVYGKTQASAEFYIQKTLLNYLIFRCCRLYGRGSSDNKKNWFEKMQYSLAKHQNIKMDGYLNCGFLDVYYLGMIIKLAIEKKVTNRLFQINTNDICSFYDFGHTYAEVFGESKDFITRAKWPYPFLKNSSIQGYSDTLYFEMDISNLEGFIKIKMPSIKESLQFTHKRFNGADVTKKRSQKGEGVSFI